MPKMKTKSAAKKRFKITATGKVKSAGTMVLAEPDGKKVIKNFLPNGL